MQQASQQHILGQNFGDTETLRTSTPTVLSTQQSSSNYPPMFPTESHEPSLAGLMARTSLSTIFDYGHKREIKAPDAEDMEAGEVAKLLKGMDLQKRKGVHDWQRDYGRETEIFRIIGDNDAFIGSWRKAQAQFTELEPRKGFVASICRC